MCIKKILSFIIWLHVISAIHTCPLIFVHVLNIGKAPEIVDSPKCCNDVNPGEVVSFSVQVTGDHPLEYLWEYQSGTSGFRVEGIL